MTKYDELKEEFSDASVYDFIAGPLNEIAMSPALQKNTENAIALLKFNESQYPESLEIQEVFAMVYLQERQIQQAREAADKVLARDPEIRHMKSLLKRLQEN